MSDDPNFEETSLFDFVNPDVYKRQQVSLGLHEPSHDTERSYRVSAFCQKTGNNRVIRPLSRCQIIIMSFIKAEIGSPVLQGNSCSGNHNAAAEMIIITLDV